jgi:hypothetical protein
MSHDISVGTDGAAVAAQIPAIDFARWQFRWHLEKWSEDACEFVRRREGLLRGEGVSSALLRKLIGNPDLGERFVEGNLLTNAGIQRMEDLLIAAGGQALDATHSRVGVGDGTTAAAATDTDLAAIAGGTHRQFKVMNATFPSRSGQVVTWQSDFATGEANFAWNEWGVDAGTANGTTVAAPLFNRKVESLGTKATGTWTLSGAVTIT